MSLVLFTKSLSDHNVPQLIERGRALGVDGFDLCVRAGHPVQPETAATTLVAAVRDLQAAGLAVPMVTGPFDLLRPGHPAAHPIMAAMDAAGVRLLKLGYFAFDPVHEDYWAAVERTRAALAGWSELAARYRVKVCYHTHSRGNLGLNAGMLAHLLRGFDPALIGAYLDPCHLLIEGEEFATGAAIVAEHLAIIGLKDALLVREQRAADTAQGSSLTHGSAAIRWVEAGDGMVDWSAVRATLRRLEFAGPLSIHCEYQDPPGGHLAAMQREVTFFRSLFASPESG